MVGSAHDVAEVISAVADLFRAILWPIVVLFLVLLLRGELPGLARRMRRLILRRGDRSLEIELDQAQEAAEELERDAEKLAAVEPTTEPEPAADLLALGATDPRLSVITLSAEIEREAQRYLATFSDPSGWRNRSLGLLLERTGLPETLKSAAREFRDVRNQIAHGRGAPPDEATRAVGIGVTIREAIRRLPREVHYVAQPNLALYEDPEATRKREDVHGIMLESHRPNDTPLIRVFPTTHTDYVKDEAVTWEWNHDRVWQDSWYRDPQTGEVTFAFNFSSEFAGRNLDAI
jgi:hypothetical protein